VLAWRSILNTTTDDRFVVDGFAVPRNRSIKRYKMEVVVFSCIMNEVEYWLSDRPFYYEPRRGEDSQLSRRKFRNPYLKEMFYADNTRIPMLPKFGKNEESIAGECYEHNYDHPRWRHTPYNAKEFVARCIKEQKCQVELARVRYDINRWNVALREEWEERNRNRMRIKRPRICKDHVICCHEFEDEDVKDIGSPDESEDAKSVQSDITCHCSQLHGEGDYCPCEQALSDDPPDLWDIYIGAGMNTKDGWLSMNDYTEVIGNEIIFEFLKTVLTVGDLHEALNLCKLFDVRRALEQLLYTHFCTIYELTVPSDVVDAGIAFEMHKMFDGGHLYHDSYPTFKEYGRHVLKREMRVPKLKLYHKRRA